MYSLVKDRFSGTVFTGRFKKEDNLSYFFKPPKKKKTGINQCLEAEIQKATFMIVIIGEITIEQHGLVWFKEMIVIHDICKV